jgi:mannitol-1-phosphate/altronate dehydrogenase
VVQDTFSDGRPSLEEVGVQMVGDVHPYETMKLRLLNASHSAIGYNGTLAGYSTVDQVMADPLFRTLMQRQMREDVAPLLPPVPGIDLDAYQETLVERFSNPKIADQLGRVCLDGSAKVPKFVIPALRDALDAGRPHRWLTVTLAGWLRYLNGIDDAGQAIALQEPRLAELEPLAREGRDDPRALLSVRNLFGDLGDREAFVAELQMTLRDLYTLGTRPTLARYLESPLPPESSS